MLLSIYYSFTVGMTLCLVEFRDFCYLYCTVFVVLFCSNLFRRILISFLGLLYLLV